MRKVIFAVLVLLYSSALSLAQDFESYKAQKLAEREKFSQGKKEAFEEYRQKLNAEYADYMRQRWSDYEVFAGEALPLRPEPPRPVVKNPDEKPQSEPRPLVLDIQESLTGEENFSEETTADVVGNSQDSTEKPNVEYNNPVWVFEFYGTACSVKADSSYRFSLEGVSNDSVATAWMRLSSQRYYDLVDELLELRRILNLCDWGYVRLTEIFSTSLFGIPSNESRLLQMFILVQSGYKIRIAQGSGKLLVLLPFNGDTNVYTYSYVEQDGCKYYILAHKDDVRKISVYDREFPNERLCSLEIVSQPALDNNPVNIRDYVAARYPSVAVRLNVNRNMVDFYRDYPITDAWDMYVRTSISGSLSEQLYPQLHSAIASKNKVEAADMLLDFVQTAFDYKVDNEQFGRERPLFADETFFYPYCDCEDRAILYAILVRELLGLDVLLLNYPSHLATAVCFGEDIPGSYIEYSGKRFFVCDPTYIGASIGDAMPGLDNSKFSVVEI